MYFLILYFYILLLVEFSIESLCEDELPLILDDNTQWSNNINPIFLELGSYIQTIGQLNGPPRWKYTSNSIYWG